MKKIRLQFIALLLLTVLCGCAKKEVLNLGSKGANIICFGDSITFGYGANEGEDYPDKLRSLVFLPVINAGVDGDSSYDGLARLESDVLEKDPRLVIVEFGGNDFLQKIPVEETIKNLSAIIDRILQKGSMVALVDISSGFFLQDYRNKFKKLAEDKKIIFIPQILKNIITNPAMKSDFFHPNARGYQIIAQRVHKGISAYLQ